jgi:galactose mutarotase-like enzyme
VITVVMDTAYDVAFGRLDAQHGHSRSRSTRISEIDSAGTSKERVLGPDEEHGFLWRQNIYWSYEERDGGLYMQIESVSLTRSIPTGLGWIVGPFVESVPRDSLEFTLQAVRNALRK